MSVANVNAAAKPMSAAQKVRRLHLALLEAVTETDMKALGAKLLDRAQEGSVSAAKLMLGYVLGRPDKWEPWSEEEGTSEVREAAATMAAEQLAEEMRRMMSVSISEAEIAEARREAERARPNGVNGQAKANEGKRRR